MKPFIDIELMAQILRAKKAHDEHKRWRTRRDIAEGPVVPGEFRKVLRGAK